MASRNEVSRNVSKARSHATVKAPHPKPAESPDDSSRTKKKKNYDTYKTFIQKLLQDEHPGGIGGGALDIVDSYVKINHDNLIRNADLILRRSKKKTLGEKEIFSAVLLTVSDDFSAEVNREGNRAVSAYVSSSASKDGSRGRSSKSSKADLVFPVSRIGDRVKATSCIEGLRVGEKAVVFLTAVLEFFTRKLLRSAGEVATNGKNKHKRITARDIKLAIVGDGGLQELTKGVYVPGGVAVETRR